MMTESNSSTVEPFEIVAARLADVKEPPSPEEQAGLDVPQGEVIPQMVRQAKDAGVALTGPPGY
jgi:putative transposase